MIPQHLCPQGSPLGGGERAVEALTRPLPGRGQESCGTLIRQRPCSWEPDQASKEGAGEEWKEASLSLHNPVTCWLRRAKLLEKSESGLGK